MTAVYVAGPMRGINQFNFPAFDQAAHILRQRGYTVCNPAEHDRDEHGDDFTPENAESKGFSLRDALAYDLDWIARNADGVAVLPGWEMSKGARAEVALAHALGLVVGPWQHFEAWGPPAEYNRIVDELTSAPGKLFGDRREVPDEDDAYRTGQALAALRAKLTAPHAPTSDELTDLFRPDAACATSGEVRSVSSTGGEKGTKPQRYDLLPRFALDQIAEHYARGASKYADHNWRRGYELSKSFAALQRHIFAWWDGEEVDADGWPHLPAVGFHVFALMQIVHDIDRGIFPAEFDDRFRYPAR